MTNFEKALINRDKISVEEAKQQRREAREMFYEMMEEGASYDEVEEMMCFEYGLEMDYIDDLI